MLRALTWIWITLLATAAAEGPAGAEAARAGAEVRGRVASGEGIAVERAQVTVVDGGGEVFTDRRGWFVIDGCDLPCSLRVTHPRFLDAEVAVAGPERVEIVLAAKQQVFEHVDVTAAHSVGDAFAPVSVASTVVRGEDMAAAPATLTELVGGVAGVAENGQGGIFQVFSIRGVSRQRVLTLVAGVPIFGERRAGVSASFLDPTLMGSADVLRGPASTYYGSGALGGVVQVFPRTYEGLHLDAGYDSFGDSHYQRVGWGTPDGWSLGVAHRAAGNGEAADGSELNSHFTQASAVLTRRFRARGLDWEVEAIPSYGRDIGKSNSDFPERITSYPRENHLLLRLRVGSRGDGEASEPWRLAVFAHPNDLVTADLRPGQRFTEVENEAFDFGANWQREWSRGGGWSGGYGLDFTGRRGVDAFERQEDLQDGSITELSTLDGGAQDEAAAWGTARRGWGAATLQAGGRFTWQRQHNGGAPGREDTAWTAFVGYVRPLGGGIELAANLGTGLRFPNLSERFFTGTTGRGGVIGNPDLEPESSLAADLGVRWYGTETFLSAGVFRLAIDDYIERVEVDDDRLSFVNLTSGTISGLEVEGFHQLSEPWLLSWSGHLLGGEDAAGNPLADVPAHRLQLSLEYRRGGWQSRLEIQQRASKSDPGSGEQAIPAARLVAASLRYRLRSDLTLVLRGRNLLDEEYFNSADEQSPRAPGRSVGLSLSWSGAG